jgi:acetyl/propionyl-CoA carboxylase alpha subunit
VDHGIEEGQELGTSFDSMCAKLIAHASTRALTIRKIRYLLKETVISGVGTNLDYLHQIACAPAVVAGSVSTRFLDREFGDYAPKVEESSLALLRAFEDSGIQTSQDSPVAGASSGARQDSTAIWSKNPL